MGIGGPGAPRTCRAKIGLLVLRDCAAEAVTACPSCNRSLCKQHRVKTQAGERCPECCAKSGMVPTAVPVRRARQRSSYYDRYEYRPYYYSRGDGEYFQDYDHRTFDAERHVPYDPLEDQGVGLQDTDEGRDWLGLDDFGES